ncbi:MAG: 23S rRNA (pseudouridine(1915)-N(3))-methyltransferase RlmH [Erysipelotrichaceae bacterium]|nr:23S rRNA (pseudouridine(1915)-N(3))-methyltransferase RlmH [Erysipelotrichaceae bacterium]
MIKLVCVGKCKEKALIQLIGEYLKRLGAYTKVEIIETEELVAPQSNSLAQNQQVIEQESEASLKKIKSGDYVILLDLHGKTMTSEKFAEKIKDVQTYKSSDITFVIGGSLGVSDALRRRSDFAWKLSDNTFPHQIVRLLVLEQVYRAFKILRNEPYHK